MTLKMPQGKRTKMFFLIFFHTFFGCTGVPGTLYLSKLIKVADIQKVINKTM